MRAQRARRIVGAAGRGRMPAGAVARATALVLRIFASLGRVQGVVWAGLTT